MHVLEMPRGVPPVAELVLEPSVPPTINSMPRNSKQTAVFHLRGRPCTPQQANEIAVQEMKRGDLQEALKILTLILAKAPHPIVPRTERSA
jgi:hypothetical protein